MVWTRWIRDILITLTGLGIEIHEAVVPVEPRPLTVVTGLLLVGVPVDAMLARWLLPGGSRSEQESGSRSAVTPPKGSS
jgi:hypothetical protein